MHDAFWKMTLLGKLSSSDDDAFWKMMLSCIKRRLSKMTLFGKGYIKNDSAALPAKPRKK